VVLAWRKRQSLSGDGKRGGNIPRVIQKPRAGLVVLALAAVVLTSVPDRPDAFNFEPDPGTIPSAWLAPRAARNVDAPVRNDSTDRGKGSNSASWRL
jgi:hypothetical protein